MELTARKEKILASVINAYVATGEPVGSKGVAAALGVSSATVRNEMAELILLGLLEQPHTSAGRVPSQAGYRWFVDRLQPHALPDEAERHVIDMHLYAGATDAEKLLASAARLLAELTHCAVVAVAPDGREARVRALQFVQTSRRSAMVIMISSAGTMKSRVFRCDFDLTGEIMRIFFRVINEKLVKRTVAEITPALIQTLAASMGETAMLMSAPLMAVYEAARDTGQPALFHAGEMNLLRYPEFAGLVGAVTQLLESPREMAALLGDMPEDTLVRIGRETGRAQLNEASVLAARSRVQGEPAGTLALVGPMRMNYRRALATLEYTAQALGRQLETLLQEE